MPSLPHEGRRSPARGANRRRMPSSIAAVALLALPFLAATSPVWQTDLAHTRAEFTVSHMVVSKVWGHVPVRSLTIVGKPGSAIPVELDATLDPSHEDTDNHDRDADLRSATYFDVAKYPTMTFKSTSIVAKDAKDFVVTGALTIKNVTKTISFPVTIVGIIPDGVGKWRVGYNAQLQVDRRDYDLVDARLSPAGVLLVGYTVDIGLTVEATTNDPGLRATT
jgi:polyisoprenoid-binding protein YceI